MVLKYNSILHFIQVSQVWRHSLQVNSDDITLVTQMTDDRIHLLNLVGEHWPGPISVAIYCSESALRNLTETFKAFPQLLMRTNVDIHLVHKRGVCKILLIDLLLTRYVADKSEQK